jgi:hypothetical protein
VALSLLIDSVEKVGNLKHGTLSITTSSAAASGRADFTLIDFLPYIQVWGSTYPTVVISDGATTYFDGKITVETVKETRGAHFEVRCSAQNPTSTATVPYPAPFGLIYNTANVPRVPEDLVWYCNQTMGDAVGYWRLGESSGTVADDLAATPHDGTYVGSPTMGQTGPMFDGTTAVLFNGSSQYVNTNATNLLRGKADLLIAAWVKTTASASGMIFCERTAAAANSMVRLYIDASGNPTFQWRDSAGTLDTATPVSGFAVNDGEWHHIAGLKQDGHLLVFVDGVQKRDMLQTSNDTMTGALVDYIGRDPTSTPAYFAGTIGEVLVWSSADSAIDYTGIVIGRLAATRGYEEYVKAELTVNAAQGTSFVASTHSLKVSTYAPGLVAGMVLGFTSANMGLGWNWTAVISELTLTFVGKTTPLWTASLGSLQQRLYELWAP